MSNLNPLESKSMVLSPGSFIDITEHKAAQDTMLESEETFKRLFEESPSGLALVDAQGFIRKANRALLNMLGISPEILIDKNFMDLVAAFGLHTEDYRTDFKERLADRNSNTELTFTTLNGIKTTVSVQSSPIRTDGNVTNILYILTDITESKLTEGALLESERKYRLLSDNSADVIWILDLNTRKFTYFSPSVQNLRGYTPEEAMALTLEKTLTPESLANVMKDMMEGLEESGKPCSDPDCSRTIETEELCKDGSSVFVESKIKFLRDDTGRPISVIGSSRDNTERRRADEVLKESEEKFRMMMNSSADAVFIADANGNYTYTNPKASEMLGYSAEEFGKMNIKDISREEDMGKTLREFQQLLQTGNLFTELSLLKKDGSIILTELNAVVMENKGIYGSCRDITERKLFQDTLRKSEQKYRQLVDTANEAILVAQDGLLKFVNRKAIELVDGFTEQELFNVPFTEFIHPDDRELVVENYKRRIKGEEVDDRYRFRVITRTGMVKWVEISAVLIDWEGKPATLNFLSDITDRREAETAMRESEERFRSIFENSKDGILVSNKKGEFLFSNPAMSEMLGYTKEELKALRVPDIHPQKDLPMVMDVFSKVVLEEIKTAHDLPMQRKDGSVIYADIKGNSITLEGQPCLVGVFRDITERKDMVEALKMNLHDLERYKKATIDRELKMMELKEKLKVLDQKDGVS